MTASSTTRRSSARAWAWAAGLVALIVSSGLCLRDYYPPLPSPLELEMSLNRAAPGPPEPILLSGRPGSADWLEIKRLDERTVAFGYESWGSVPLFSAPIAIEPGVRRTLRIEMPGLSQIRGQFQPETRRLSVVYGGATVLEADVPYHVRASTELNFGQNPNGGAGLAPELRGRLYHLDGRELRGGVAGYLTRMDRVVGWLRTSRPKIIALLLLSVALGAFVFRLGQVTVARLTLIGVMARATLARHRWFAVCAAISSFAFAYVLTYGRGQLIYPESFGAFYDFQAGSLLQGRWDVPEDALGAEAFVVEGRNYGYFGPTPALLRIPFVLFQIAVGQLSRPFMLAEHLACMVAAYLILRHVYRTARGEDVEPAAWTVVLLTLNVGLGSTLFFLSSRAFTYHEAILCGTAFALASIYCALRYGAEPERRWWIGALICGTLSVHARPPVGLFALSFLGFSALAFSVRGYVSGLRAGRSTVRRRMAGGLKHFVVGLLCIAGVLSFNAVSYLKFRSFEGAPLKYHVQYESAHLDRIGGRNFHLSNLPYIAEAYLIRPMWQFRPAFPYVYAGEHQPVGYPDARVIVAEPMLGLPFSMPGLFWPAIGGLVAAFFRYRTERRALLILGLAAVPMSLAMFTAVATSQRYTADFCPFLICAAAYAGLVVDGMTTAWRRAARTVWTVLTAAAILLTVALTLRYQGELVWGVPADVTRDYRALCARVDNLFDTAHESK